MEDGNTSTAIFEYEEFEDRFSVELKIVIGVTLSFLVIVTVAGNVLTIVSFLRDKQLRKVQNIYIFNLSLVDLAVGVVSVPYYIFYTINNYTWTFGRTWCKIWLVIDFLVCAESSLTIILISFDRFMLVSQGASYVAKQTVRQATVYIICSWVFSFLLYGPAIIFWEYWIGARTTPDDDCDVEFFNNMEYTLITAMLEFLIPLVLTAYFNFRVYLNIRKRSRKVFPSSTQVESSQTRGQHDQGEGQNNEPLAEMEDQHAQAIGLKESQNNDAQGQYNLAQDQVEGQLDAAEGQPDQSHGEREEQESSSMGQRKDQNDLSREDGAGRGEHSDPQREHQSASVSRTLTPTGTASLTNGMIVKSQNKARQILLKRDRRAARSLSVLVIVYFMCWTPYTVMTFIESVKPETVDKDVYEASNFLLWVNSACNPFLYALMSARFRENYKRLLCVCKR